MRASTHAERARWLAWAAAAVHCACSPAAKPAATPKAADAAAIDADATAAPDATVAVDGDPQVEVAPAADSAAPQCSTAADCPAAPPCTVAACSPTGACAYAPKADGAACDDADACTTKDQCSGGACAGTGTLLCDDENPCTADKCNPLAGCLNPPVAPSTTCDDGDPCSSGDVCVGGKCQPGIAICQCQTSADCAAKDDGDLCNGTLYCDKGAGPPYTCKPNPATVVTCSTANDSACQENTCAPATGQCKLVLAPANTPCTDNNACTTGDFCDAGACLGGTNTCTCKQDSDCAGKEDGNACNGVLFCNKATAQCQLNPATVVTCQTAGDTACLQTLCNPKDGKCHAVVQNEGQPCGDGNPCTPNEACKGGKCASAINTCLCQSDADCKAKEDGNLCNGTLYCDVATKQCAVNPATVVVCPTAGDGPCEVNTCNPKTGLCAALTLPKDGTACDDGSFCTPASQCAGGKCVGTANTCQCQANADCAAKDDGNPCNGTLYCDLGTGKCAVNPATVVVCPKAFDETCLTNQCDPATGQCGMKAAHQGNPCSDGSVCSSGGWCDLGVCAGQSQAACECAADADCAKLEDGDACNGTLYCDKSAVLSGGKPACKVKAQSVVVCPTTADSACSKNLCNKATGACQAVAQAGPCNDGKACTELDACAAGACVGLGKVCADSEVCTLDVCQEPFGCVHLPDSQSPCDDGSVCTTADACAAGQCLGKPKPCDDGNPCTNDGCNAEKGCQFAANAAPCEDGDACTHNDGCDGKTGCAWRGRRRLATTATCVRRMRATRRLGRAATPRRRRCARTRRRAPTTAATRNRGVHTSPWMPSATMATLARWTPAN
ncbi:MAG: hypothetical protein FJ100_20485 [Deltaproteobacteria bacterium]|nr:hypothetical protein [Deltaproteobacteria bacterium]